jgi:hypothetical protein
VWACAGFRNMQRTVRRGREDDYGRSSLSATESPLEDHRMAGSDPRRRPKHYYYRELNEVPSLIRLKSRRRGRKHVRSRLLYRRLPRRSRGPNAQSCPGGRCWPGQIPTRLPFCACSASPGGPAGAKFLGERCAEPLGRDVIHSVTNPLGRLTAAIHVYGGDFYGAKRSDWDPENLLERDYDFALHRRMFEEANAA